MVIYFSIYLGITIPIGSMYAIYGNIYHQYTANVSIYTIHGSYGIRLITIVSSPSVSLLVNPRRAEDLAVQQDRAE
jgi:hypothetical protein